MVYLCFVLFVLFFILFFIIIIIIIIMFYLHICTLFIQLTPVHNNPVTDTHRMLLSSKYHFLHLIRKYDYVKQMADTETVNNRIMTH
jgi:hypothetical protein